MSKFWQTKQLDEMSDKEWELLCDGCAKCCLVKLEDYDTGEIYTTNLACKLLDIASCRCKDYSARQSIVDDCLKLDRDNILSLSWLPESCSYKLIARGEPLPDWHHLISGKNDDMHAVGASVKYLAVSELEVQDSDIEDHIIRWVD
jgi:uncharacterized cysteine cluster protein YcgN (CxxCxxCC family)